LGEPKYNITCPHEVIYKILSTHRFFRRAKSFRGEKVSDKKNTSKRGAKPGGGFRIEAI